MTTTAPHTLPTDFVAPSECLQQSDFWIWSWGDPSDARTVLGGPSQTSICFPTSGDPTGTYENPTTTCPPSYTFACRDSRSHNGPATCCPDAHSFTCVTTMRTESHGMFFRCKSQWGTATDQTVTVRDMLRDVETVKIRPQKVNGHLWALGLAYTTATEISQLASSDQPTNTNSPINTSSATNTSSPTNTSNSNDSSRSTGLSPGASAGIGIGVAVGVISFAAMVLCFLRRRKRTRESPTLSEPYPTPPVYPQEYHSVPSMTTAGDELSAGYKHEAPVHNTRHEMEQGNSTVNELEANPVRNELPGTN